jgi:hypothetical protein
VYFNTGHVPLRIIEFSDATKTSHWYWFVEKRYLRDALDVISRRPLLATIKACEADGIVCAGKSVHETAYGAIVHNPAFCFLINDFDFVWDPEEDGLA